MRDYHGPSAEAGLTAQEYRETMDEYDDERDDLTDYPDTLDEDDTDGDDD